MADERPDGGQHRPTGACLGLLEAGVLAGFEVAEIAEDALLELLHVAYWAACVGSQQVS